MLSKRSLRAAERRLTPSAAINLVIGVAIAISLALILLVVSGHKPSCSNPSFNPVVYRNA